jgi:hypothetical protein
VNETPEQRIRRKAREIRTALIQRGVVISPNPYMPFDSLPLDRQQRWIKIATAYVEAFPI